MSLQLNTVPILTGGIEALRAANSEWGLALAEDEIAYLVDAYTTVLKRDPTDVELLMFAQVGCIVWG
jgi:phosphoribosylformylglycinamidine synthase